MFGQKALQELGFQSAFGNRLENQRHQRFRQFDPAAGGKRMGIGRHFSPGFANDVEPLFFRVFSMLAGKAEHVAFDEDKAGDVFQHLRIRVGLDALLALSLIHI